MNLKISLRALAKNKLLSLLSIIVLTFGMTSFILIFFYIQYEESYDNMWDGSDRIFRIALEKSLPNGTIASTATNYDGLCRVIADEIPGVDEATGFQRDIVTAYTPENFLKDADFFWCDTSFFRIFNQPFVAGDIKNPFPTIQSAVISESAAMSLFGRKDPVNQRFRVNEGWEFIVSGVFADLPDNSHLKIDILITRKTLYYFINNFDNSTSGLKPESDSIAGAAEPAASVRWLWDHPNVYTYVRLKKNVNGEMITRSFPAIYEKYTSHLTALGQSSRFIIQPVRSIHLDSHLSNEVIQNAERRTIAILYVIAFLALAISWVIFINFQITQSMERSKEFGLKRISGDRASGLLIQIMLQSFIINSIAIFLSFLIFYLLRPVLSGFLQLHQLIPVAGVTLLLFFAVFISGSILSSLYPAYMLITRSPRQLLADNFVRGNDGFKLRRSLIVFQFSASIGLMITTFVIIRQVLYLKSMDVGLNLSRTAYSYTPMSMIKKEGATRKLITFLDECSGLPGVIAATVSSCVPGQEINYHSNTIYASDSPSKSGDNFGIIAIDHHYQDVFGPEILAGQMFTTEDKPGDPKAVINREACRRLGFGSPDAAIGKFIQVIVNDYLNIPETPYLVIGVVEDFHQESPKKRIEPCLLVKNYQWKYEVGFVTLKYRSSDQEQQTIKMIREKWEDFYPGDPFAIQYTDKMYRLKMNTEEKLALLSLVYTIVSVILASLGLYGLASNSARKRVKEIGIRKINGARVSSLVLLLNRDFFIWIAISFLIASPVAWFAMKRWLSNFAYRTELSWWLFMLAGALVVLVAMLTITWQSFKAASMNPVEALRYE